MNLFRNCAEDRDPQALMNVILYKLSQLTGKQVVMTSLHDRLNNDDFALEPYQLTENRNDEYGTLAKNLQTQLLTVLGEGHTVEVVILNGYTVSGEFENSLTGLRTDRLYMDNLGVQVKVWSNTDKLFDFQCSNLTRLNSAYYPVDIERLVELRDKVTDNEPMALLHKQDIHDITLTETIDDEVMESVSIAALAAGWNDTEARGCMMALIH